MADDLDILTTEEAGAALNLNAGRVPSNAEQIDQWVTAVSRRIDALVGPVVVRTITDEIHHVNGHGQITPNYQPVSSITSITEYVSGTGTALTAEDFDTVGTYLLDEGVVYRRSGWLGYAFQGTVKVTYVAGRYATTETVDARYKAAAGAALRRLWAREAGAWSRANPFDGDDGGALGFFQAIDPVVQELLPDQVRVFGFA